MKQAWLTASIIVVVGVFVMHSKPFSSSECTTARVTTPSGNILTVEVANTYTKRVHGLSNRDTIGEYDGMLFLFPTPDKHAFWMKNTRIPLDIIWIRNNTVQEVITLEEESTDKIPRHTPTHVANMVLEIGAGKADDYQLTPGNRITMPENCRAQS